MRKILLCILLIVFSTFAFAKAERVVGKSRDDGGTISDDSIRTLANTIKTIRDEHVSQVPESRLIEYAINGMISSLDPHSSFYNKEALSEMELHTSGEFEGVGIEVTVENGLTRVLTPIDDSPAQKAGIKSGDYIVAINDENVHGLSPYEAISKIRGKPHTSVKLTILREDSATPIEFNLNREKIKIDSVKSKIIEDSILYLRISYFYGNTASLVEDAIKKALKTSKLNGIIIDLRNNPGGLLDQAVDVASIFIDNGDIVYTKGKNENSTVNYATNKKMFKVKNIPIAVLINNGSASGAEIVAAALQDYNIAVILGTRSFGKGSVQTLIPIENDGAISLTTALYYTPSGKSIQLEGVVPDISVEDVEIKKFKEENNFREENIKGHLDRSSNINRSNKDAVIEMVNKKKYDSHSKTLYKEDYMVVRALDLLKGINIYNINNKEKLLDKNQ